MKHEQARVIAAAMPSPPDDWPVGVPFEAQLVTRWIGDDCVAFKAWLAGGDEPAKWTQIMEPSA
jgi:hypothetical protein